MEQEPKERKNFGGRQTRLSELQRQRYSQEGLDPLRQLAVCRKEPFVGRISSDIELQKDQFQA